MRQSGVGVSEEGKLLEFHIYDLQHSTQNPIFLTIFKKDWGKNVQNADIINGCLIIFYSNKVIKGFSLKDVLNVPKSQVIRLLRNKLITCFS